MIFKMLFTTAMCSLVTIFAHAQAKITSKNLPDTGEVHTMFVADTAGINPGIQGANQVWDFRKLKATGDSEVVTYLDPAKTSYASNFPDATIVRQSMTGAPNQMFLKYDKDSGAMKLVGMVEQVGAQTMVLTYDEPMLVDRYPQDENYKVDNIFVATSFVSGSQLFDAGTVHQEAYGYGTLELPGRNYENVLCIRKTTNETDTFNGQSFQSVQDEYDYVTDGVKDILLSISTAVIHQNGKLYTSSKTIFFNDKYTQKTGIENEKLMHADIEVYPNPASDNCSLLFTAEKEGLASILIYNSGGQIVRSICRQQVHAGKNNISMDLKDMPQGIYMARIEMAGELAIGRIVK